MGDHDWAFVGEVELDVIHLRGHTPGSPALVYRDAAGSHLPGHGDDTTLGTERPSLPEWKSRGR